MNPKYIYIFFFYSEKIVSENWYLGATFSSLLGVNKKFFWKPINFQLWTETPWTPRKKTSSYLKFIDVTHSQMSGRGRGSGVIIILLKKKNSLEIPDLVHGPTAAPVAAEYRR